MRALLLAVVMALSLPLAGRASTEPVFGYWLAENRRAIIEIAPCGEAACGRMVWLREPADGQGEPRRDVHGAPLCGLALVEGLRRADGSRWDSGRIYNPRDGRQYSASLTLIEDDRLEVRGWLGLPVFGRSQVWTRTPGDRGGC